MVVCTRNAQAKHRDLTKFVSRVRAAAEASMVDRVAKAMKGDGLQQTIWKWQSRFLFRR